VGVWLAADIEVVGVCELRGISVGGGKYDTDPRLGGDEDATQHGRGGGGTKEHSDRRVKPQRLRYCGFGELRVRA
jgi:hypothetical protein